MNLHNFSGIILPYIVKYICEDSAMINVLVGNKNIDEIDILRQELTNDEIFEIKSAYTGMDTITAYWKFNPDILILDSELPDMSTKNIIDKLSCTPIERKRCNTILTVPTNYIMQLTNLQKINEIVYKPISDNKLSNVVRKIAIDYNTPDIEVGEIDWLLQSLNFNCMSTRLYLYERCNYLLLLQT